MGMSEEMLRTLSGMDLAGVGERLFFRTLVSFSEVKALKSMDGETPNLIGCYSELLLLLLYLMRRKS